MRPERQSYALALAALLFLVLTLLALHAKGAASRRFVRPAPAPVMVNDARELYDYWKRSGAHGRRLLNAGKYLSYVSTHMSDEMAAENDGYPLRLYDTLPAFEDRASTAQSYLWLAMMSGIAREVTHLVPAALFADRRASVLDMPASEDAGITEHSLTLNDNGSERIITDMIAARSVEPYIVNVDASYFMGATLQEVESLHGALKDGKLEYDLLSFDLAMSNPDVDDDARQRLSGFADRFNAKGAAR